MAVGQQLQGPSEVCNLDAAILAAGTWFLVTFIMWLITRQRQKVERKKYIFKISEGPCGSLKSLKIASVKCFC